MSEMESATAPAAIGYGAPAASPCFCRTRVRIRTEDSGGQLTWWIALHQMAD